MDGLKLLGGVLFGMGWVTADLAIAAWDAITGRDADAELKRFLATHQDARWYYPDGEPGN